MKVIPVKLAEYPRIKSALAAHTFFERARGLLGRDGLPPDCGMLIERCNAIHTFFMRFAIDAVFLDRNGAVVKIVRNIKPWHPCVWGGFRAKSVIEIQSAKETER